MRGFSLNRIGLLGAVTILLTFASAGASEPPAAPSARFDPEKAGFALRFKQEVSSYRVIAVFVLPQETLKLEVVEPPQAKEYLLESTAGNATLGPSRPCLWQAPGATGLCPVKITDIQSGDSITLHVFVMVPYSQLTGEYLNGYRIGKYPTIPLKQLPMYKPPRGFVEVTRENEETLVSPHFGLKQFLCKQASDFPKYLVLRERLLLKLELILEKLNAKGYDCSSLGVMSGYRTPYYNRAIGNVKYSRHLWGGAADIFVDREPEDGMMDDLNNDGKIDYRDAAIVYDIVDGLYGEPFYVPFVGGLARYPLAASHGPFVHVDVRGFRVRWGD